jgi:hypothetical protein
MNPIRLKYEKYHTFRRLLFNKGCGESIGLIVVPDSNPEKDAESMRANYSGNLKRVYLREVIVENVSLFL